MSNDITIDYPSKFEGCLLAVPYYWEQAIDGIYDLDVTYGGDCFYIFILKKEDREALGADKDDYSLWLHEDQWGFVHDQIMDKHTHRNFMKRIEKQFFKSRFLTGK